MSARLALALRVASLAAVALAVGALVLPDPLRRWSGWAMVGVVVGVPAARVAWLAGHWLHEGDRRFAAWALALLALLGVATALAFVVPGRG